MARLYYFYDREKKYTFAFPTRKEALKYVYQYLDDHEMGTIYYDQGRTKPCCTVEMFGSSMFGWTANYYEGNHTSWGNGPMRTVRPDGTIVTIGGGRPAKKMVKRPTKKTVKKK